MPAAFPPGYSSRTVQLTTHIHPHAVPQEECANLARRCVTGQFSNGFSAIGVWTHVASACARGNQDEH